MKMTTLSKYTYVNDLVCQLTDNKALRTFYILYLMAETNEERLKLNATFNEASSFLNGEELTSFKKDFTHSFKKILPLLKDLNNSLSELNESIKAHKQAA